MKFLLIAVLAATAVLAAPAPDLNAFDSAMDSILVGREIIDNCGECQVHYDTCMKYGHGMTPNIEHCADICATYLCKKWVGCKDCDDKYNKCRPYASDA